MERNRYLFAYFLGNEPHQERICLAVSDDGYHFTPLNGNEPVIVQTKGKQCVRDPYIFKGQDEYYYIVGTDMKCIEGWESNHALVVWRSKDLIDWSDENIIDMCDLGEDFVDTTRAWAPQAIWDEKENMYMLYWAHSTKRNNTAGMYYAHTKDFRTITTPKPLYCRYCQTIDGDIIYNEAEKLYYLYFKYEESQTIAYVTSENVSGPYEDKPVVVSLAKSGVEGSEMYKISGTDKWVMIMDEYSKGRFFMQETTDFHSFTPVTDYDMDFGPRHGSVTAITDEEYNRLINHFGR
jgi:hypothetical protein